MRVSVLFVFGVGFGCSSLVFWVEMESFVEFEVFIVIVEVECVEGLVQGYWVNWMVSVMCIDICIEDIL